MTVLNNYLNEIQTSNKEEYLHEDVEVLSLIKSFLGKVKSWDLKSISGELGEAIETRNFAKMQSMIKRFKIPSVSNETMKNILKKKYPQKFEKSYNFAARVINNSVSKASEKTIDYIATAIAIKSVQGDDVMEETKKNLETCVPKLRKYIGTGVGGYSGETIGTIIIVLFILASIVASISGLVSFPILIGVGALLLLLKAIL